MTPTSPDSLPRPRPRAVDAADPAVSIDSSVAVGPAEPPGTRRAGPVALLLVGLVRFYQLVISPWLGPSCRFEPSCSAYAIDAFRLHGAIKGSWLTLRRLGRCQPFCSGGYDPVPEPRHPRRRWATRSHSTHEESSRAGGTPGPTDIDHPRRFSQGRAPSSESPVASGSPDRGVHAC